MPQRGPLVDAVLVGIEKVDVRLGPDCLVHSLEREGGEFVVVIEEDHEGSASHRQGRVRVGRDTPVGSQKLDPIATVTGSVVLQELASLVAARIGAGDAGFPAGKLLVFQGIERPPEKVGLHPIDRNQHAEKRFGGRVGRTADGCAESLLGNLQRRDPGCVFGRRGRPARHMLRPGHHRSPERQAAEPSLGPAAAEVMLHATDRRAEPGDPLTDCPDRSTELHLARPSAAEELLVVAVSLWPCVSETARPAGLPSRPRDGRDTMDLVRARQGQIATPVSPAQTPGFSEHSAFRPDL